MKIGLLSNYFRNKRFHVATPYIIGGRVLDVGCDDGYLRKLLHDREYVGIDVIDQKVDFAYHKRNALESLADLGMFDSIALLAVIEHVKDYERMLKNLSKSLKSDGDIVITTPSRFGNAVLRFFAKIGLTSEDTPDEHVSILSLKELEKILEKLGFEMIEKRRFLFWGNQLIVGRKK